MTFNSAAFVVLAAVFFAVWPWVRGRDQARWAWITVVSFVFYGWWDWRYCGLLAATGLVDFWVGLAMERRPARRRLLLVTSLAANLGTLAIFKYGAFFAETTNAALAAFGDAQVPVVRLTLPIGISFYTFHSISYVLDVYRGAVRPTRHVLHFFSYLTMFPHLVAGPIIRGADTLPQLARDNPVTEDERWRGMRLVALGFFKKMVLADNLAPLVNGAFGAPAPADSAPHWWLVSAAFAFQILCDFSGYSDIARGLAAWMGVRFPLNFDEPYGATSVRAFWQRWHVSLSSWFRDYLYIPLGGSRGGRARSMAAMWATMLTSGLWHGASWTFVVWGAIHAAYLTVERLTRWPDRLAARAAGRWAAAAVVFALVTVAWVFFRAETLGQAARIVATMFDPSRLAFATPVGWGPAPLVALATAALLSLRAFAAPRLTFDAVFRSPAWGVGAVAALLAATVLLRGPGGTFIYFQF